MRRLRWRYRPEFVLLPIFQSLAGTDRVGIPRVGLGLIAVAWLMVDDFGRATHHGDAYCVGFAGLQMTPDDQAEMVPETRRLHLGLSGKLLGLTILFVMTAVVLIYVPSIATYRVNWINDRLAAAHTSSPADMRLSLRSIAGDAWTVRAVSHAHEK